jgi:putative peptidoglycan lipid II flippase
VPRFGHAGLALSIGLGAIVNALWLLIGLRRRGMYTPEPGWLGFAARVLLATLVLGAFLAWAQHGIDWLGLRSQPWLRAGAMAACLGGAGALYFGLLLASGLRLRQFMRRG